MSSLRKMFDRFGTNMNKMFDDLHKDMDDMFDSTELDSVSAPSDGTVVKETSEEETRPDGTRIVRKVVIKRTVTKQ